MRGHEPTTVGLSAYSHRFLGELQTNGDFRQLVDGYRFAVALAMAHGGIANVIESKATVFNVGTLDPDHTLKNTVDILVGSLYPDEPIYRIIERLAEWGIQHMAELSEAGSINYVELLRD